MSVRFHKVLLFLTQRSFVYHNLLWSMTVQTVGDSAFGVFPGICPVASCESSPSPDPIGSHGHRRHGWRKGDLEPRVHELEQSGQLPGACESRVVGRWREAQALFRSDAE